MFRQLERSEMHCPPRKLPANCNNLAPLELNWNQLKVATVCVSNNRCYFSRYYYCADLDSWCPARGFSRKSSAPPTPKKKKNIWQNLHNVRWGLTQTRWHSPLVVTPAVGLMEVTPPQRSGASSLNSKKRFICKSPSTYHSLLLP